MGKHIHKLTNVDRDRRLGDCAACGPGIELNVFRTGQRCRKGRRGYTRSTQHSLTRGEAEALKQKHGCAVCGETDFDLLRVDHCHDSGDLRGVLCDRHNLVLGYVNDNPDELQALIEYLTNPPYKRYA